MSSQKLSAEASALLKKIREKHQAAFEPLKVADVEVRLLRVRDLESLLEGRDPFRDVSAFPFWVKLWEASLVLAHLIARLPEGGNKRLLELGAGLGAPGLVAAARGYQVTLSDYEELIRDFQVVSAHASGLAERVDCRLIDWLSPPELPKFDVLVGAEILFREEFFEPLLNVFDRYLADDGTIYLAHDVRRKSLPQFLLKAEKDYEIAVSTRKMRGDGEELTIIVNRLTRRKG